MRVLIVGGGLVGLGSSYAIQRLLPGSEITICEKELELGLHQSTHNSGVLHAGLHYAPGSSKAVLAVRGIRLMVAFAQKHRIPHEQCGKLVVATREDQLLQLRNLVERGRANGLRNVTWVDGDETREIEPYARGLAAIRVPEEGIIDYRKVVDALHREVSALGGNTVTAARVDRAVWRNGEWIVGAGRQEFRADFVLNCAGLQSDRVACTFGVRPATRVVPFRGEYFTLARPELVRHLVYPVPDPRMPFLGVHFTRTTSGAVECGPNAVLALAREGYAPWSVDTRDALDALTSLRLWRFVARHPSAAIFEVRRSLSKQVFLKSLQRLVPDVSDADLQPGPVGIRAQAMRANGQLVEDFDFVEQHAALHVLNAPSPAATASLAIGEVIAQRIARQVGLSLESSQLEMVS